MKKEKGKEDKTNMKPPILNTNTQILHILKVFNVFNGTKGGGAPRVLEDKVDQGWLDDARYAGE
jgi:hypothetical protein